MKDDISNRTTGGRTETEIGFSDDIQSGEGQFGEIQSGEGDPGEDSSKPGEILSGEGDSGEESSGASQPGDNTSGGMSRSPRRYKLYDRFAERVSLRTIDAVILITAALIIGLLIFGIATGSPR